MTGRIIPLRGDPHERIQSLLPWFVTGRLDAVERAEVEAHLSACPDCRTEERLERRLSAEVSAMPMDVEQSWARLRARLERPAPRASPRQRPGWPAAWRGKSWTPWAMAAQAAAIVVLAGFLVPRAAAPRGAGAGYHTLAAGAPAARSGDVVVMFRPDMPERDLRAALEAGHARLVDGPTAAGAYVVSVPAAGRAAALAELRRHAGVTMAESLDRAGQP